MVQIQLFQLFQHPALHNEITMYFFRNISKVHINLWFRGGGKFSLITICINTIRTSPPMRATEAVVLGSRLVGCTHLCPCTCHHCFSFPFQGQTGKEKHPQDLLWYNVIFHQILPYPYQWIIAAKFNILSINTDKHSISDLKKKIKLTPYCMAIFFLLFMVFLCHSAYQNRVF